VSFAQKQPDAPTLIGFLPLGSPSNSYDRSLVDAFRQGLREVGLKENKDITVDVVWVSNDSEYPKAVGALVQRGVRVLIPAGTSASVAAMRETSTIPIIFTTVGDPIGIGLVKELARPGSNATGFSDVLLDLSGKYVEMASAVGDPQAAIHYLWYTGWANGQRRFEATERSAKVAGVKLRSRGIADIAEANDVMVALKKDGATTLIIQPSPFTYLQRTRLIDSASNHGLGTIFAWPVAAREGALIAYGPDYADLYRRAASYVNQIIKGAKPGDLPVQQPTKLDLVINLKTARALGLLIPQSLILRADDVIV
jgi:putative ABC transport system substrate-binding protein